MLRDLGFQKQAKRRNDSYDDLIAGAAGGFVSSVSTHALDTLAVSSQAKDPRKLKDIKGLSAKAKHLYKGVGWRTAKIVPAMAISFATYGGVKKYLKKLDKKNTKTTL
jgi:hypothetical protein